MSKDYFPTVYAGERNSGKTTRLLERAAATRKPILTHNTLMKKLLEDSAKRIGFNDIKVITVNELEGMRVDEVIIDEVQLMLQHLLKVRIDSMSATTYELVDLGGTKEHR